MLRLHPERLLQTSVQVKRRHNVKIGRYLVLIAIGGVVLTSCATMEESKPIAKGEQMMAKEQSLCERLGGKEAITAVVGEFVGRVAADARVNTFFGGTDIPRLKMQLVNQICEASGGPCTYTGRSMKDTHRGMGVSSAHFDAVVEDLVGALDKFNVPAKEKSELLGVLGPMRKDIVEK